MIIGISGKKQHGKDTLAQIIQWLTANKRSTKAGLELKSLSNLKQTLTSSMLDEILSTGSQYYIKKFANKLKQIVCLLLGCTMGQLEDNNFKETLLGEEWRVWYISHYKLKTNKDPFGRFGRLHNTKEEAELELVNWSHGSEGLSIQSYILTPRLLLQLIGTECGRSLIHPNIWVNALMTDYVRDAGYSYEVEPMGGLGMSSTQRLKVKTEPKPYDNGLPNWIITDVRFPNEAEAILDRGGILLRIIRDDIKSDDTHESETALDNYTKFTAVIHNNGTVEDLIRSTENLLTTHNLL